MNSEYDSGEYHFQAIEAKWQKKWDETKIFDPVEDYNKQKYYVLVEFPYPSGDGLHVGHPRGYTAMDVVARYKRLKNFNVLIPFGWDAFGLPTENFAIKNKIHPKIATEKNVKRFKKQCKMLGFSFAWGREINTTHSDYYKWTQWIFLQLFNKGLAYKSKIPINWCTSCNVGLANEEVVNDSCERCGGEIVRKEREQWMLQITAYAEKLLNGLNEVKYIDRVKVQQRNWIGKSEGATVDFKIKDTDDFLNIFTTRPDTLYGATYMVVAPEHPLINKYASRITNLDELKNYIKDSAAKSDLERTELSLEKTGVEIKGLTAINPVNNKEIPIWISDYIIMSYGTGAIMAVPAHDQRDYLFAKKFNLDIIEVIKGGNIEVEAYTNTDKGVLVNSEIINDLVPKDAIIKMNSWLEEKNIGKKAVNYKLRDWVFSRQRYWGEPIPIVKCKECGLVPLDESELPLTLPEIDDYRTTDDGDSPLLKAVDWVNVKCPKCGIDAKRETDTMPQWAGSSWYYLRYTDFNNDKCAFSSEKEKYWMPVDWYNGGMEHTTLHLLYSRFWHRFLYDNGIVSTPEPYIKRTSHGMVLGNNSEKMSKSRGNVINPDDIVEEFGADTFRLYEMFMGAFDQSIPWNSDQINGVYRFLKKIWTLAEKVDYDKEFEDLPIIHKSIKKVEDDIIAAKFNTAIAQLMVFQRELSALDKVSKKSFEILLILLSPYAPHICEELWQLLGHQNSIQQANWVDYDKEKIIDEVVTLPVTINGKVRANIEVPMDSEEKDVEEVVFNHDKIKSMLEGKQIVKKIYVKNRIYNIAIKK